MKKHGLFGKGLSHSLSPDIHKYVYELISYNADYSLIDFKEDQLEKHVSYLRNGSINGVNVTMPYKKSIIKYLDVLDKDAESIDAVNTIVSSNEGLIGYNTDYYGIKKTLEPYMPINKKTFLVLGYGGACKPLIHFLIKNKSEKIYIASRTPWKYKNFCENATEVFFIGYNEVKNVKGSIVFNTTPLGMYPNFNSCPLDDSYFKNFDCAIDFIYNPFQTNFLKKAQENGLKTENGLKMLVYQAIKSIELWSNIPIPKESKREIYLHFRSLNVKDEKIFLVGMPGSGKSTFGKMLANSLEYQFIDLDEYIENMEGMKVSDIFRIYGENRFRELETLALKYIDSQKNLVVATGGGTIISKENRDLLSKYKYVLYLDRPCKEISKQLEVENRPLLKNNPNEIFSIYEKRKDFYKEVSSYVLNNSSSLDFLLEKAVNLF